MIAFKGATAYEFQWGRWYLRICYLRGAYWRFKPWRRFSLMRETVLDRMAENAQELGLYDEGKEKSDAE